MSRAMAIPVIFTACIVSLCAGIAVGNCKQIQVPPNDSPPAKHTAPHAADDAEVALLSEGSVAYCYGVRVDTTIPCVQGKRTIPDWLAIGGDDLWERCVGATECTMIDLTLTADELERPQCERAYWLRVRDAAGNVITEVPWE